jgi:multiple sugar transport system ATP-binding protein
MVRQPSVFLMDEPLSNLDAALRISMRAEIKQLHQAMQTTFVYVTHDQAEALTLADRIVVMREGVVQQIGSPDEIYEHPRNTFVASFLGNPPINYLDGVLEVAGGSVTFRRGELALGVPSPIAERLAAFPGREVTIGIRAEDVSEHGAPQPGRALGGRITSVLPVGSDNFLEIEVEGRQLFFRVGKEVHHRDGDSAVLAVNVNRLHFFDKASGNSLIWGSAPA